MATSGLRAKAVAAQALVLDLVERDTRQPHELGAGDLFVPVAHHGRGEPSVHEGVGDQPVLFAQALDQLETYAVIVILGLTGLFAYMRLDTVRWLGLVLGTLIAGQSLFFVVSRYRLALVPGLALLSGACLASLLARRPRAWPVVAVSVLLVLPWGLGQTRETWQSLALANEALRWGELAAAEDAPAARDHAIALYRQALAGPVVGPAPWLGWLALLLIVFLVGLIAGGLRVALRVFLIVLSIMLMAGWLIGGVMGAYRLEVAAQLVGMILLVAAAIVAGLLGRVVAGTMGGAAIMIVALGAGVITGETGGGLGALLVSVMIVIAAKRGLADPDADRPIHRLAYRIARLRGTRFAGADMRGAALPASGLRNCDVTGALMDGSGEADTPTPIEQPGSD